MPDALGRRKTVHWRKEEHCNTNLTYPFYSCLFFIVAIHKAEKYTDVPNFLSELYNNRVERGSQGHHVQHAPPPQSRKSSS